MPYSRAELAEHSRKIGRGWRTLQRWVARGCDLRNPESVQKFLAEAERRKTNVRRHQEARGNQPKAPAVSIGKPQRPLEPNGNGECRRQVDVAQELRCDAWKNRRNAATHDCG